MLFQFPLSERTNCNTRIRHHYRIKKLAFSFLYRNERTATDLNAIRAMNQFNFQFPLSERTNCNELDILDTRVSRSLFQFPLSERTNCNHRDKYGFFCTSLLSVSSIGTNELQRRQNRKQNRRQNRFQFPLSERTNCNSTRQNQRRNRRQRLSVSSIGTNELQQNS